MRRRTSLVVLVCICALIDAATATCTVTKHEDGKRSCDINALVLFPCNSQNFTSLHLMRRTKRTFEMFQRDFANDFPRLVRHKRHSDLSIVDRNHSRTGVSEIQRESDLSEHARLRHQRDFRLRLRRSEISEEARSVVQQHHDREGSVVRRSGVSRAIGSLVQSRRVDRAHRL